MNRIDLNRVAIFTEIAESGGVTAAAERLGVPKSTVSRALKHLEDHLGVELIVRTSRQFRLTDAGRAFFDSASQGIAVVEGARDRIKREREVPHGLVRLAAGPSFASWLLAPVLSAFVREHPDVEIDLAVRGGEIDPIRDGFDLVLTTSRLDDSSLLVRKLGNVEWGVFASQGYLDRKGEPKRVQDLARHDCVLISSDRAKVRWKLASPAAGNGKPTVTEVAVGGRFRVDDVVSAAASAAAGAGLAALPIHLPPKHFGAPLVRVLGDHLVVTEPARLVYPATRHLPLRVSLLVEAILASAENTCREHGQTEQTPKVTPLRTNGANRLLAATR